MAATRLFRWSLIVPVARSLTAGVSFHRCTSSAIIRLPKPAICFACQQRGYKIQKSGIEVDADEPPATTEEVQRRAFDAIRRFDRLPKDVELKLDSNFQNDFGLDSLDHVEIMMTIEEEFNLEIPDPEAEKLLTPQLVVQYLCEHFDIID